MTAVAVADPVRVYDPIRPIAHRLDALGVAGPVRAAVLGHLADPTVPAQELARRIGGALGDVVAGYGVVREDPVIGELVGSLFYPHRLCWQVAAATVAEWLVEPLRAARLLAGEPMLSSTVELHPSKGTSSYRCQMCLWSDQDQLTYRTRDLRADGLLSAEDWCRVLDELHAGGSRTVVLSGGGEVLMNRDLPVLLRHARHLGLRVQLYTTGYHLPSEHTDLWDELVQIDQVRFSIHSPHPATYDAITGLPPRLGALDRVTANMVRLLEHRRAELRLGIGFVALPANLAEIVAMADFAAGLGVDFLALRKDEVDVTGDLTGDQVALVRMQLNAVRDTAGAGSYGAMRLDLGDELVAIANGQRIVRRRTAECLAKYFRPTVSPYGIITPCDLTAEPRFAHSSLNLGQARLAPIAETVARMPDNTVPDACEQCMPSSRTGNAVHHKLLTDLRDGVPLTDQPFGFRK